MRNRDSICRSVCVRQRARVTPCIHSMQNYSDVKRSITVTRFARLLLRQKVPIGHGNERWIAQTQRRTLLLQFFWPRRRYSVKLAFHDADTDANTLADSPDRLTSLRKSSRGCRCRCRRRGILAEAACSDRSSSVSVLSVCRSSVTIVCFPKND